MSQHDESIKIRTLPRKNEKKKEEAQPPAPRMPRWIIYVGTSSVFLFGVILLADKPAGPAATKAAAAHAPQVQQAEMASVTTRQNASVSRHLQDSYMQHQMMVQAQQMENSKMKTADLESDAFALDSSRTFGVQLEPDHVADRVYEDLNMNENSYAESTPDEKISARLANRKWVNELERREKITFIRNFIRSAYARGYEVQLDQNLVVVGVKKINETRKVNIDQIIDKLALGR